MFVHDSNKNGLTDIAIWNERMFSNFEKTMNRLVKVDVRNPRSKNLYITKIHGTKLEIKTSNAATTKNARNRTSTRTFPTSNSTHQKKVEFRESHVSPVLVSTNVAIKSYDNKNTPLNIESELENEIVSMFHSWKARRIQRKTRKSR